MILLEDLFNPNDMSLIPAGSVLTIFEEHEWVEEYDEPDEEIELDAVIADTSRPYVGNYDSKIVILPRLKGIDDRKKAKAAEYITDNRPKLGVKRAVRKQNHVIPAKDGEDFNAYLIHSVEGVPVRKFMKRAKIVRADTDVNTTKGNQGDEWLDKAMAALTKAVKDGYVKLTNEVLPDIFWDKGSDIPYRVVRSVDEDNDYVMLMSPRHGEGLYIMKDKIELPGYNKLLPWNKAIDIYIDNAKQEEDRRYLLSFREMLHDTNQGIFFRRDKYEFDDILINMAAGNLDDLDSLKESILKFLSMIIESRILNKL